MKASLERMREYPGNGIAVAAAAVLAIPFTFMTLFFTLNERALMAASNLGVLDLELAWTPGQVHKIFAAWGHAQIEYQVFTHHVDNWYAVCYGTFAALLILLIARQLKGRVQQVGFLFVFAPVLAAVFDLMENVFLLSMLERSLDFTRSSPLPASICATFKIAFLGATLSFVFVAGVALLVQRYGIGNAYWYPVLLLGGVAVVLALYMWEPFLCFVIGPIYLLVALLVVWCMRAIYVSRR